MNIQRKYDIAVALLEVGIDMHKLRWCPETEFPGIARRCGVSKEDVESFAEEVGKRQEFQQKAAAQERIKKRQTLVLFTDDRECDKMVLDLCLGERPDSIKENRRWIDEGYNVVFLVRNVRCAQIWSTALGVPIHATTDQRPHIPAGSVVISPVPMTDYLRVSAVRIPRDLG